MGTQKAKRPKVHRHTPGFVTSTKFARFVKRIGKQLPGEKSGFYLVDIDRKTFQKTKAERIKLSILKSSFKQKQKKNPIYQAKQAAKALRRSLKYLSQIKESHA